MDLDRQRAHGWPTPGVPFELAEAALAHTVGNAVVAAYKAIVATLALRCSR
jgi:hypothetical protein